MAAARARHTRWSWAGLLLTLLAAALWGLAPVATKAALAGFSPELIGFLRLAVAALLFRLVSGEGARWFVADPWAWLAGAALGLDFILYNYGIRYTTASVAGLVINVEMISTIAFAVWLLGERLSLHRVVGSAITLGGVLLVSVDGFSLSDITDRRRLAGNLLVMAAGVSWSLFAVAQRRARPGPNLFTGLAPIFSVAALTTLPMLLRRAAWAWSGGLTPTVMLLVLIVLGTGLVYWIYARAQQLIDLSVLAVLLSSIPIFSLVFACGFLGEPLTARLLLGSSVVVAGIVVIAAETGGGPEVVQAAGKQRPRRVSARRLARLRSGGAT